MTVREFSLDGEWNLVGIGPARDEKIEIPAHLPSQVHVDLLKAGLIPDPFWRDQANQCQWVEDWEWTYSKSFTLGADFPRDWAVLEFQGLDTFAAISLNGVELGKTANMFVAHSFEVGRFLKEGPNQVQVRFTPYKLAIAGKPLEPYEAAFDTRDRVHVRRMQCTFHWDWVNRFVSAGIWRPVKLYSYEQARVSDLFVYTTAIDETGAGLSVEFDVDQRGSRPLLAQVEILDPQGKVAWSRKLRMVTGVKRFSPTLPDPQLWWPNGYGEQPLYRARVAVWEGARLLDQSETTFGIRTVRVAEVQDPPGSAAEQMTRRMRTVWQDENNGDEAGSGFILLINGKAIFGKGGNWVPADPFPARITPEKYAHLIRLARDGHLNILRAWGGGIYEPPAFWDACDRCGILVTQDFEMACARYPEDDPEFMANLNDEAPKAIRMLRNHPSLVWWSGDNECGMNADFDTPAYPGLAAAEQVTGVHCRLLDPSRPFFLTSPYGGKPNTSRTIGDSHTSGLWSEIIYPIQSDMADYQERINQAVGRFMSETTAFGSPAERSLLRFMTEADLADPASTMFNFHTKDNPYKPIKDTLFDMLDVGSRKLFGVPVDPTRRIAQMEYFGHEWTRLVVESVRRKKWYCSGLQFWMFNDCWPASGWSMIDYYGIPKAGWYAAKTAFQPVIGSIERCADLFRIWVCSDLLRPIQGKAQVYFQPWSGPPVCQREIQVSLPANQSQIVAEIPALDLEPMLNKAGVLVCDLDLPGLPAHRAWHFAGMPHEMQPPRVTLAARSSGSRAQGEITIQAETYARVVTLAAPRESLAVFSSNYFDLLPGEGRTVTWEDEQGNTDPADIQVHAWNE